MYDRPDPLEQLAAVAAFLREQVMPRFDGQLAFHVRVAANVLDAVGRQIRLAPAADRDELARLRELLGTEGTLEALNRDLCSHIAAGRIGHQTPGLSEHLWQVAQDKLAVDQPAYETLLRLFGDGQNKEASA